MPIHHIKQTVREALVPLSPVAIPLSTEPFETRGISVEIPDREQVDAGVWECEPGRSQRTVEAAEIVHILAGDALFTSDDGQAVHMRAGDTLFFPPMTMGGAVTLTVTGQKIGMRGNHSESGGRILGDIGEFVPGFKSCNELFAIERGAEQVTLEREVLTDWSEARQESLRALG